jgi:hypothetical protein
LESGEPLIQPLDKAWTGREKCCREEGRNMVRNVYTYYAESAAVQDYLSSSADWLTRIRKVKGFAVTCPDASTGMTKIIDVAAPDEETARRICQELQHSALEVVPFKGVVRGEPKVIRDPGELGMLAAKVRTFLQRDRDGHTISPEEPGSNCEGCVGGTSTIEVNRVRKAIRYGENVYVMVVRCTQTNAPRPGYTGGNVNKFDQGLAFAGNVNLDNTALA